MTRCVAMVDPGTGRAQFTPEGILSAQVKHIRALGCQATFAAANPQCDAGWLGEVAASVAAYRADAASAVAAGQGGAPGTLDAPITRGEIHDAMLA